MSNSIDLEHYFHRIAYQGPHTPTIDVLHALTATHTQSIPFENIDVLLGLPILLDPKSIFQKLVLTRRGGYCFEQNGLFLKALLQLGFNARPLAARVRLDQPDRSIPTSCTHMLIEVQVDGHAWITDVGIGSASLTRALRLNNPAEQPTLHDTRRLLRVDNHYYHQALRHDAWTDVYEFVEETMHLVDRKVANWYTSTHPESSFRTHLAVALTHADGTTSTLSNRTYKRHGPGGLKEKRVYRDAHQLMDVLRDHFGIEAPPETLRVLNTLSSDEG